MKRLLRLASAILFAVTLLLAMGASADADGVAQESTALAWRIEPLGARDDGTLRGHRAVETWTFELPAGWSADGAGLLTLHLRGSPLLADEAALSITANDRPLTSLYIRPESQVATVVVPKAALQEGRNTLRFQAVLPLTRDPTCIDPDHPGRWVEVQPNSRLFLRVSPDARPLAISEVTSAFRPLHGVASDRVAIVLPRDPATPVLDAAAMVSGAVLGARAAGRLELIWADDFVTDDWEGPALLFGPTDMNPHVGNLAPPDGEAPWLAIRRPDWSGGHPVLAVGGPDATSVHAAARALADPQQRIRMAGPVARVPPPVDAEPDDAEPDREEIPDRVTLAGLGYGDRTASGFGEQSLTYAFDMPFAWAPAEGAVELHLAHAAIVAVDVHQLIVALNGRRLAGVRLDAPEVSDNRIELALPADLLRPGRNFLRFTFEFGRPVPRCDGTTQTEPWATVRAATGLSLPHADGGGRLDWDDFPYLLSHPRDLQQLQVVLPEEPSARDVRDVLRLIAVLADGAAEAAPRLITPDAIDELDGQQHTILLGTADRQPHLQEINASLPVPFDLATGELQSRHLDRFARTLRVVELRGMELQGMELQGTRDSGPDPGPGDRRWVPTGIPEALRPPRGGIIDFGVLQAMRVPDRSDRMILVVSGASEAGYRRALAALIDGAFHETLAGQLVLVGGSVGSQRPTVISWTTPDLAAVPAVRWVDRALSNRFAPDSPWPVAILVGAALLAVGAVSMLWLRWWQHRAPSGAGH